MCVFGLLAQDEISGDRDGVAVRILLPGKPDSCVLAAQRFLRAQLLFVLLLQLELYPLLLDLLHLQHVNLLALLDRSDLLLVLVGGGLLLTSKVELVLDACVALVLGARLQ